MVINIEQNPAKGPLVDLRGVTKTFESAAGTFTALQKIDLRVRAGEFVAIIGKSGSGKSTLLNMIAGIDRPTSGEVRVNGAAIHQLNEGQVASWRGVNVGLVFQFFQLIPTLTAIENIMLPMDFCNVYPDNEREQRAKYLLELVGIAGQAGKLPAALSGGEQQRVAIARALANDPPLIIADEPTGNLDSKTAALVFDLFRDLVRQGKTVLMVTHDKELARTVPHRIELTDGRINGRNVREANL
ncbi:MAG TPA: ABC transporter ATP-binding protein [Anaerolineales bacterium]|nr:ABC transporter ATP-binding protein [Anaerolineales bacterium]